MRLYILFLLEVLLFGCSDPSTAISTGKEGQPLPTFEVLLMDSSTVVNTRSLQSENPTVLFLFSPTCMFCRAQTEQILDQITSLRNIQFILVSPSSFEMIKEFYKKFEMAKYPNITFGWDYKNFVSTHYKVNGVPYIAIFDKRKILKQAFLGTVSNSDIKKIALQ